MTQPRNLSPSRERQRRWACANPDKEAAKNYAYREKNGERVRVQPQPPDTLF